MNKSSFKVSELHHAFFNHIANNGATAGVNARVIGSTLFHEPQVPAASFIAGLRVESLVIFPAHNANESRWTVIDLRAAIPRKDMPVVILQQWPQLRDWNPEAFNVSELCKRYMASIESDARRSIHSVNDTEGVTPTKIPAYAAALNDLIALAWIDGNARQATMRAWRKLRDNWNIAEDGKSDISTMRAIAQREAIEAEAIRPRETLNNYFNARNAVVTIPQRLALVESFTRSDLNDSICRIMRAGLSPAERRLYTVNPSALIAADFDSVKRAADIRAFPRFMAGLWREIVHNQRVYARGTSARAWPQRMHDAANSAFDYAGKRQERERVKAALAESIVALKSGQIAAQELDALKDTDAFDSRLATLRTYRAAYRGHGSDCVQTAARWIGENFPKHPALREYAATIAHGNDAQIQRVEDALNNMAAQIREREAAARVAAMIEIISDCARMMLSGLPRSALQKLSRDTYPLQSYSAASQYGDSLQDLKERAEQCNALCRAKALRVPAEVEWMNGGTVAPDNGDWMRVIGERGKTTRGVEVSMKGVRIALAWLAKQPPGKAVAPAGFEISGYSFTGRDADGTVRVGCHAFTPAAVENIIAQAGA